MTNLVISNIVYTFSLQKVYSETAARQITEIYYTVPSQLARITIRDITEINFLRNVKTILSQMAW